MGNGSKSGQAPAPVSEPHREGGFWTWGDRCGEVEVRFAGRGPRRPLAAAVRAVAGAPPPHPAWARQVHSAVVLDAVAGCAGSGDALVTDHRDLALAVVTADCVPILVAGERELAAIHAGWRGLAAGVVTAALDRLGEDPAVLTAWIGPAIGGCCYEVGPVVAERIVAALPAGTADAVVRRGGGRPRVDLSAAVTRILEARGLREVRRLGECTRCAGERLWSYRRHGEEAGRNLAVVWRREGSAVPGMGPDCAKTQ